MKFIALMAVLTTLTITTRVQHHEPCGLINVETGECVQIEVIRGTTLHVEDNVGGFQHTNHYTLQPAGVQQ